MYSNHCIVSIANQHQVCRLFLSFAVDTPLASSPSSANLLIPLINDLILELPTINDPLDFCTCLSRMSYGRCQEIHTDYHGTIRSQVIEMVAAWYKLSAKRSWAEVVDALFCHRNIREGTQLAERKGVDWEPLLKKWYQKRE